MLLCQPGVATGMSPLRTDGFWRQLTFHLGGGTHNHRVRRDIVRHHSAGSNQCAFPNDNAVQNNRTDADEASISRQAPWITARWPMVTSEPMSTG